MTIWSQFVEAVVGKQDIDPHKDAVDELMLELQQFETQSWVSNMIDQIAYDTFDLQATINVWSDLTDYQKQLAFMYLLGCVKALMQPPSEDHSVVTV